MKLINKTPKKLRARLKRSFTSACDADSLLRGLDGGHLTCAECGHYAFHVEVKPEEEKFNLECEKCALSFEMKLKGILNDKFGEEGQCKCPECGKEPWIFVRSGTSLLIGCKTCPFQLNISLNIRSGIILYDETGTALN
jgi:transcription elongation factor Elf1